MESNPYKILGVPSNATKEEIKKARKRLCAIHHPDQGGDTKKFNLVNEAYNKLMGGEVYSSSTRSTYLRHSTLFSFKINAI